MSAGISNFRQQIVTPNKMYYQQKQFKKIYEQAVKTRTYTTHRKYSQHNTHTNTCVNMHVITCMDVHIYVCTITRRYKSECSYSTKKS